MEEQEIMEVRDDAFIESENIENLFSDELSPFLKHGMTWLFFVGFALFSLTYFLKWPEVIKAPAILTTSERPKALIPKYAGKINNLYVTNGSLVNAGQVLATMENAAKGSEINQLNRLIAAVDSIYQHNVEDAVNISLNYFQLSNLGDVQPSYEQFQRAHSELKFALSDAFLSNKLYLIKQRLVSLQEIQLNLKLQRNTIYEDYALAVSRYEKEKMLFEKGSITSYELKDYESIMLNKRLSFQNTKNAIIQNERQQQDLMEEKIQLTQTIESQKNNFIQAFKTMKSAYTQWVSSHVITSPINGKVSLSSSIQQDVSVGVQDPVMYIIPLNAKPIVQLLLPQYNLSAVDTNKTVRIKLTAYPYEDFGVLEGRLIGISRMPVDGKYEATVELKYGMRTSFNKKIEFINGMEGEAEIVLNDERLMVRLFRKLRS